MKTVRTWSKLGITVKRRLKELGQTQQWLIGQVRLHTDKYLDSSNLYKLMTGQYHSKELEAAIKKVLQYPNPAALKKHTERVSSK